MENAAIVEDQRAPLAPFAMMRIFLGFVWLYEAYRGAPWAWPAGVVGLFLLIGVITPPSSLIGAILTVSVYTRAGSPQAWGTWPWLYWVIILMHLVVFLSAAGRVWGVDSILARRKPLWPLW